MQHMQGIHFRSLTLHAFSVKLVQVNENNPNHFSFITGKNSILEMERRKIYQRNSLACQYNIAWKLNR